MLDYRKRLVVFDGVLMSVVPFPEPLVLNPSYRQAEARFAKEYFANLLQKHEWNVTAVAKEAGMNLSRCSEKLEALGLRRVRRYKRKEKIVRAATG